MSDILAWFSKKHSELVGDDEYDMLSRGLSPVTEEDRNWRDDIAVSDDINLAFDEKKLRSVMFDYPITDITALSLLDAQFKGIATARTREAVMAILGEPADVKEPPTPCPRPLRDWGGTLKYNVAEYMVLSFILNADKTTVRRISVHALL